MILNYYCTLINDLAKKLKAILFLDEFQCWTNKTKHLNGSTLSIMPNTTGHKNKISESTSQ